MFRQWTVLLCLAALTIFFQNCGSPQNETGVSPVPVETLTAQESHALEVLEYLTLSGIDWQNMTDTEIIDAVVQQLEALLASLPPSSATHTRISKLLALIKDSAEFRTMVVAAIREASASKPTPTPATPVYPACNVDVSPFVVDRTVANALTFTWISENAQYAQFKYWDGMTQLTRNIALNGTMVLNLRANFSTRPDILPFNVMVVDAKGIVRKCTIFVEFK